VTVTTELIIRPEDREEFLALTKELRLIFLRNGAFFYRVDEIIERPGTFRMEMRANSWGEYIRQRARTAKAEDDFVERVHAMHSGERELVVRHRVGSVPETVAGPLGRVGKRERRRLFCRFTRPKRRDSSK
jgi:Transmembrane secretion effector